MESILQKHILTGSKISMIALYICGVLFIVWLLHQKEQLKYAIKNRAILIPTSLYHAHRHYLQHLFYLYLTLLKGE